MDMLGTLFETAEDRAVARARAVLEDTTVQPQANHRQRAILRTLLGHRGLARAIGATSLARLIGSNDRVLRADIRDLRLNFSQRIGSSRERDGGGYYLITNADELRATAAPMVHQLQSEVAVIRAMCEPHELRELAGQLNFDLSEAATGGA